MKRHGFCLQNPGLGRRKRMPATTWPQYKAYGDWEGFWPPQWNPGASSWSDVGWDKAWTWANRRVRAHVLDGGNPRNTQPQLQETSPYAENSTHLYFWSIKFKVGSYGIDSGLRQARSTSWKAGYISQKYPTSSCSPRGTIKNVGDHCPRSLTKKDSFKIRC